MFEVCYYKNGNFVKHVDVNIDTLLDLLKAHKEGQVDIVSVEDQNHHSYDFKSLIENLKL